MLVATAGVRSCASFPLKREGEVVGAFSLYASEPEFFDEELVTLLDGMAADGSLSITSSVKSSGGTRSRNSDWPLPFTSRAPRVSW